MALGFPSRRRIVQALLAALAGPTLPPGVRAQEAWPSRPLRFIVPQPAGGTGDVISRIVAQKLSARWGQQIVVDNKAGAGGTLGATAAARSAPDGYTLVLSSAGFATFEQMFPQLVPNPASELVPAGMLGLVPIAIEVRADSPFHALADVVAYAKANPGKLSYASAGIGSSSHLMGAWLRSVAGIDILHVPYAGTAPALTALLGGQADLFLDPMAGSELIKSGKVRVLAVTDAERSPMLPQAATLSELGYAVKGSVWLGVMAPAATPRPVLEKINADLRAVLEDPAVRQQMAARYVAPHPLSLAESAAFFANETRTLGRLVRDNGIRPE